jgi:hypothetical protein
MNRNHKNDNHTIESQYAARYDAADTYTTRL